MRSGSRLALIVLAAPLVLAACDGGAIEQKPSPSPVATNLTAATVTPPQTGLTQYDPSSALRVEGRERLRACVEALEEGVDVEAVAAAIEEALLVAVGDPQWPASFGTPAVDSGCPLPPVALDPARGTLARRTPCLAEVSAYLVFVFIADPSRLTERFGEQTVRDAEGVRKAGQEEVLGDTGCAGQVSEAWYLTPDEWQDPDLLQRFIFGPLGIFTIADFQRR